MSDAIVVQIAEALCDAMKAHDGFSLSADIQAAYIPKLDRVNAGQPIVTIIPRGDAWELDTRSSARHTYRVLIDVRQAIQPGDPGDINLLAKYVEEVSDFLKKRPMAGAAAMTAESDQLYDPTELYGSHQFVSQIEATYTLQRSI